MHNSIDELELHLLGLTRDNVALRKEKAALQADILQMRETSANTAIHAKQLFLEKRNRVSLPNFIYDAVVDALQPGCPESVKQEALRLFSEWRARSAAPQAAALKPMVFPSR